MASSTTMPTTSVRPSTVKVFWVKPRKYMHDEGAEDGGGDGEDDVDRRRSRNPRNSQQMKDVRIAARRRLKFNSWVASSTKTVPS
jgi:hypothetical protein